MPELTVIQPLHPPPARPGVWGRLRPWALRLYRLSVIVAIVCIVRQQQVRLRFASDHPIKVEEVRGFFPTVSRLTPDPSERAGLWVLDGRGKRVGYVLRTSPACDKIVGYCGPTDTLVALTPDKINPKVVGIKVRSSLDTLQHVQDVMADGDFMGTWDGKTWDQVAGMEPKAAGIEGVSGASMTSLCIANGIRHRFEMVNEAQAKAKEAALRPPRITASNIAVALIVMMAFLLAFTRLRGTLWLRRAFQVVLIGYLGFFNGQLLGQSLLAGWAATAIPWRAAPGLALLAAAALIVPWATRRQIYCSQICPFGAAQEWVGRAARRWIRRPLTLPRGVHRGLRWLPPLLVGLVLFVTLEGIPFNLAGIEPFDAFLIRTAGAATLAVFVAGLIAAAFVPMAYCKYGCPTGMVFSFVRSHGKADGLGRRDLAAGILVLAVLAVYHWHQPLHHWLIG